MLKFKVFYKRGLGAPIVIEAENEAAAINAGLAEYRRNYGFVENVHPWPASKIVDKVVLAD